MYEVYDRHTLTQKIERKNVKTLNGPKLIFLKEEVRHYMLYKDISRVNNYFILQIITLATVECTYNKTQ